MDVVEQVEILLVEDNPLDAELTMRGLRDDEAANKITWVQDGQQALDYIFSQGQYAGRAGSKLCLILLDLKMPRVDGIEVLTRLKADESTRRIPVVVMTSSKEESDVAKTYNLGANSYIVKPIDFEALAAIAKQAGFYWLGINRSP